MTFTIDSYTLTVTGFTESSEPIGAEWVAWENNQTVIKRFIYGMKRTWQLACIEKDIAWSSSAAKYLQQKMVAGETVTFTVDEGNRFSLPATAVHITDLEIDFEQTGTKNIRKFTVILKEK